MRLSRRDEVSIEADIVVYDASDSPLLLVEVKEMRPVEGSIEQLLSYLHVTEPAIPFGLLADPERLRLYRAGGDSTTVPVADLSTAEILGLYNPGQDALLSQGTYLTGLLTAWLQDFDIHWKFSSPPGGEQLREAGLASLLKGVSIEEGVRLGMPSPR